jgi:GxxExxY protein
MELIYKQESFDIMGACFEVYKQIGYGFVESVYHQCLFIELGLRDIPFESKKQCNLDYKGHRLECIFIPDFICCEKILLEIKAVAQLENRHRAQVHNYLKATGYKLGLLVNFGGHPQVEWERIVR